MLVVVAILAILAIVAVTAFAFAGRLGEMSVERADYVPLDLGPVSATDIALLRPPTSLWGYNVQATDEAMEQIAESIRERDVRIVALEQLVTDLGRDHAPMAPLGSPYAGARHRRVPAEGEAGTLRWAGTEPSWQQPAEPAWQPPEQSWEAQEPSWEAQEPSWQQPPWHEQEAAWQPDQEQHGTGQHGTGQHGTGQHGTGQWQDQGQQAREQDWQDHGTQDDSAQGHGAQGHGAQAQEHQWQEQEQPWQQEQEQPWQSPEPPWQAPAQTQAQAPEPHSGGDTQAPPERSHD